MGEWACITVKNGRWFVIRVVEVVSIPVGRNILAVHIRSLLGK